MRKSKLKQTLSMLLAVLMVFMSMNFSVFAEELTAPADETTTTTVEAPAEPPAEEQTPAALAPAPVDEETGTTEETATDNSLQQEQPALLQAPVTNGVALAKIDDQEYTDQAAFLTAFNALTRAHTVQLLADVDLGTITTNNAEGHAAANDIFTVKKEADIILDLNGHKISAVFISNRDNSTSEYLIGNNGKLTIKDTSEEKSGVIENTSASAYSCLGTVSNRRDANLIIESGTIASVTGNAIINYGTTAIHGGTIKTTGENYGGNENGAAAIHNRGSLDISKQEGNETPVVVSTNKAIPIWVSDNFITGSATISYGEFSTAQEEIDLKIESGHLKTSITVTGGTWDKDPSSYVKPGYDIQKIDEKYVVKEGEGSTTKDVASLNELETALHAVNEHWSYINITEDVNIDKSLSIPEKAYVTINSGKKLSVSNDSKIDLAGYLENRGTLDISEIGTGWINDITHLRDYGEILGLPDAVDNVYKIKTINQLQFLQFVMINSDAAFMGTIELQNDIDAEGYRFTAMGNDTNIFSGLFNGQDYTIKNLTINTVNGSGSLFNRAKDAAFSDIKILDCKINTTNGRLGLLAASTESSMSVKNIKVTGTVAAQTSYYCGGFIGYLGSGAYVFENCDLNLNVDGGNRGYNVGTFWGSATGAATDITIVNSKNAGNISGAGSLGTVGGFGAGASTQVKLFGYEYTGCVKQGGKVVDNPPYCVNVAANSFKVCQARILGMEGSYVYYQTIQEAVTNAAEGDTIEIAPGTYNLESTLRIQKPLTLKGLGDVIITRGDTWTPKEGESKDTETGSLVLIEKTQNVKIENITVQGAKKITGSPNANGHGINIVQTTDVSLNNVTSKDNAAAGVVVNGSTVTATGLYTSGNGWYGVNVDQGSGVINDTQFTLNAPYRFGETYQIVSDKYNSSDNIEVNLPDAFVQSDLENGSVYWNDSSTMIKNQNKNRTYPTIQAAIEDANRNNTILIPAGTYAEDLNITQSVILKKVENAESDCVLDGNITVAEGKKVTLSDLNAGTNAAVMVKKGANLALINSDAFVENQHITVEKLFGTEYDTSIIKQNDQEVAKDKLSFVYLGEKIEPDTNLFKADEVSYTVKTPAQFYWLSQQINGGSIDTSKVTIKLGNDLDFHNDEWLPVGTAEYPYQGSFDGQNHKIENLKIARPVNTTDSVGLFGQVNNGKEFKDITIQTASISGNEHVSAFIGKGYVISLIDNIHIKNAELVGTHFAGGVVGQGYVTNLQNCIAENVTVTLSDANKKSDGDKAGAIIGQLCEGNMTLRNCTVTDATVSGIRDVGGIIGMAQYGNILQNCTVNGGSVTAVGEESSKPYVGGVVGRLGGDGTQKVTIYQCSSNETTVIGQEGYTGSVYGGPAENFVAAAAFNTNTGKIYTAIQAAIDEATAGDTIEIQAGTYDEAVTLTKAVNLIGPYADTEIKAEEATTDNRPDESEAILTGGITINRTDNAQNPSITISGLKFKTKGIQATGWGSDPKLENVTITDNVFDALRPSGNVAAIHFNLDGGTPAKNLTIDNNRITNVGDPVVATPNPSGINTDVVEGKTNITDNYIDGTNHSSLQISGTAKGEVTITGNTFKNWDQNYKDDQSDKDGGGRAMRFGDFSGASLTISQNKMVRDFDEQGLDKDQMAKFTKVPENGEFDLSLNYWNGKLPVTTYGKANDNSVIVVSEGTAKINAVPYYIDEAMTITRIPAEVFASDGTTSKGQYLTIQEAIDADSTEDGNIIQLADGVYTDTFSLSKNVTVKGAENGKSILQCTADPSGSGENAAILNMGTNKTAKVQNVEFNITKTGQSPINFSTAGSLTIEGCNFTGTEKVYGSNVIYGGGQKDATVIFKNNTVNLSYRMAITSLGNSSEVTGNTFNIGTDRVGDDQRTSILTIVAAEGTVNISDNIFMGANRAVGVDHSGLKAEQITIKDNQFIDVRYGLELSSKNNAECGNYDLSKNYYAITVDSNEVASPMLIEDADKSGSHFDGSTDYTGDQVNIYPYYTKRAFNEETQKYVLSGLYAPVEVQHIDGEKSTEYFGTIAKAYEAAHAGDTIVINKAQDGSDAVITENIDMNKVKAELKLMGSTTFSGTFAGSTLASMILQNGTTATFTNAELNAIQYFTSVDVENFNADVSTRIVAPTANTSQNSFIAKGGLMDYVKGDPNSTWIYGSPSDQFNGGDGTAETPWQINIPEQLKLLQTPEFKTKDKYFKLTNDITVSDWTALAKFEGNFDGNGYTLTGNNVNFIDDLAKGAKVEKLRFEGFTNLVNTNNGTVENCFTVGEKPTAIVNIMGGSGTLTDSFTAGTIAVQTNEASGTVLRVYHCGETGGIGTAMTKADMQKARFANKLNGSKEGVWDYNADIESPSAYPFVMKDGGTTTIQNLGKVIAKCDETIGSVTVKQPMDGLYLNDEVTLSASINNQFYDFGSWLMNKTKLLSTNMNYSYQVKSAEDVGEITGTFVEKEKVTITALVMDGNGKVSIDDSTPSNLANEASYVGTMATLKAIPNDGYRFAKWTTLTDTSTIVSTDPTFTFRTGTGQYQYIAWFEKVVEDQVTVTFRNSVTDTVMEMQTVKKGSDITPPVPSVYANKTFDGWYDGDKKVELVEGKIFNVTSDMTLEARYKVTETTYTVKVENGTISGTSNTEVQRKFDDPVTVVANKPEENMNFAGWSIDGSIVSYNATYTFYVKGNTTITATYTEAPVEAKPTVFIDPNVVQFDQGAGSGNLYKLQFVIRSNIPENVGYTPVKCGIVFRKADVLNSDELSINGTNVTVGGKTDITNIYTYTAVISKLPAGQVVSARGYVTYMKNGVTETIYTDMVKGIVVENK